MVAIKSMFRLGELALLLSVEVERLFSAETVVDAVAGGTVVEAASGGTVVEAVAGGSAVAAVTGGWNLIQAAVTPLSSALSVLNSAPEAGLKDALPLLRPVASAGCASWPSVAAELTVPGELPACAMTVTDEDRSGMAVLTVQLGKFGITEGIS